MAKKINLGYKENSIEQPATKKSKQLYYPTMSVYHTELPLDPDEIGDSLTAQVKLKFTGINKSRRMGQKQSMNYDFEIHEIEFSPKKKGKQHAS